MKLYEIEQELLDLIDDETGEILDPARFEELLQERDDKIEHTALWVKNIGADITALETEIKRLQDRKDSLTKRRDSLKEFIKNALNGRKLKTPLISIYETVRESVEILNSESIPDEFMKIEKTPMKTEIKNAINNGKNIAGARIISKASLVIR